MKMKKRLFAILLAFCVAFTMMPIAGSGGVAHAEDGIAANAVVTRTTMLDLTSENGKYMATNGKETTVDFTKYSVTDSVEGWSWNNETKTLTLSGARIVVTEPTFVPSSYSTLNNGYYYGVRLPGAVTVVLTAETENIIQAGDVAGETPEGIVIGSVGMGDANDLQKSVTICGSGKLTVKGGKPAKGGNTAGRISEGIYSGKVIVKDSAELEVYGDMTENTDAAAYSRGIGCSQMTITDNAQVTARGGDVKAVRSRESSGISASQSLIINGRASLKAYGGNVTKNPGESQEWSTSMGICAAGFEASANASVYAYGGKTYGDMAGSSMGVYIHKYVREKSEAKLSDNAFLYAEGGQAGGSSFGIYGDRDPQQQSHLTIKDNAYMKAVGKENGGEGADRSNGISTYGMTINGGTVIASAEAENEGSKSSIAAISLLTQPPRPTYKEGLTPTVTAGESEVAAASADAASADTYANRWVKIQASKPNYAITVVPSEINFGMVKTGYAQPTPKTVTITNTGNETVELSEEVLQENSNYTMSKLSENRIAPRRTAEITVQPKDGLAAGTYNENLTISGSNEVSASVQLKFNVTKSGGGSGGGAVTPAPAPSDPDAEVITVKEDPKDDSTSKPGEESRTNTTTKTAVKNTTTETTKNEQGQDVSKTTASVSKELGDKLLDQAVSNNSDTIEITVKSNDKNDNNGGNAGGAGVADSVKSTEVKLPKATVDAIAKNTNADLVIKTDNSEVRLDNKTLETIADAAKGDTVTIVVGENTQLKETQKPAADIVGKNGSLFDFIAKIGERLLHQFEGGKAHVTLPMPEKLKDKDVLVIYIDDNGLCKILNHSVEKVGADDYIKFTTTHFSTFAVVDKDEAEQLIQKQNAAHVKELMQKAKFKVTTTKTSKKSVKVQGTAKTSKTLISDIKSLGYTVKYQFYRSTKKSAGYKLLKTKTTNTFINTKGTKGTKYYYKARVLVYDGKTLVAKSGLKACSWGSRVWNK